MSVRIRRLQADHEQIKHGLSEHPAIRIRGVSGAPPDRYQIQYNLRSLMERADGNIAEQNEHVVEIYLTLAYPRQAPQCRMLTPVFHPNIAPHAICIGDHWAAGESLLNLIVRIGEMLAYQSYNVKSPLNGSAARWVENNGGMLPTDGRDLSPKLAAAPATAEPPAATQCHNCRAAGVPLKTCSSGHRICADCIVACSQCGKSYCLMCQLEACSTCGGLLCRSCRAACPQCSRVVCAGHLTACAACGAKGCPDCSVACEDCGKTVCLEHVRQCSQCRKGLCTEHAHACADCGSPLCQQDVKRCSACDKKVCATHFAAGSGLCSTCDAESKPKTFSLAPLAFKCPGCGMRLLGATDHVGRRVRCSQCGRIFEAREEPPSAPGMWDRGT